METFSVFILLMAAALLLVAVAQKLNIPYPLALVLGGLALGFLPILKTVPFNPNLILVAVLPPILYYGAFWTSFREFTRNWPEIFSLALGLVVASTLAIGLLFKWLLPEVSWPLAFAFGAIVSPPDAAAATTILKRFSISSRLLSVLEGESLINDAGALVLYKLAVTAILSGVFSWSEASGEFIKTVGGGVLVGAISGFVFHLFSHRFLPPVVGVMFSFLIPYLTYMGADALGVSGVLAVVVNGLILSHIFIKYLESMRRILAVPPWDIFIIFLNCFVFILIGLQLIEIAEHMPRSQMIVYALYSLGITATLILIRMTWVYATYSLFYLLARKNSLYRHSTSQIFREGAVLGWSGMRGIVSLTAALALPLVTSSGELLPGREITIYITFVVILLTLLLPGFSLPFLLKWLNIHHLSATQTSSSHRKRLLEVAQKEIASVALLNEDERSLLLDYFISRQRILEISSSTENQVQQLEKARQKILHLQRKTLLKMWENKEIEDKLLKHLELELDLEESLSIRAVMK